MRPTEPIAPKSKNPTKAELEQYHADLKRYERALMALERVLREQEKYVDARMANVLEFEEDDDCDCILCAIPKCEYYTVDKPFEFVEPIVEPMSPGDEVQYLEKLFTLKDRRRKK